jgi:hypothetical protein
LYEATGTWWPYIVVLENVDIGATLLRTLIDVDISLQLLNGEGGFTFDVAWLNSQMAVAVCWSDEGPPSSGYYETVFADWLWVGQVSWELSPYISSTGSVEEASIAAYAHNTIDTRKIDSKSRRVGTVDGSQVFLVVDVVDWGMPHPEELTPNITWTSRLLLENPAE